LIYPSVEGFFPFQITFLAFYYTIIFPKLNTLSPFFKRFPTCLAIYLLSSCPAYPNAFAAQHPFRINKMIGSIKLMLPIAKRTFFVY